MRVQPAPENHFGWLVRRSECHVTTDFRAIEVVDERDAVRAMVGYANWTPGAVQMHIAIAAPIAGKYLLDAAFSYPFEDVGVSVVYGLIPETNERSLNLARRVGFHVAHRIRNGWRGGTDLILLEMHKDTCRWLSGQRKVA